MINITKLILFVFIRTCISSESASFYGGSYISVPLEEAKSTTNIHFRLLTKNSDAILFLAAGKTDYCLIKLVSGRLKVHLNLGAGESTITSPLGLRLDDLTWHQVSFSRIDAFVNLTIDNIHISREKLPGRFFELNIHYGLFIGGQGEFSELFLGHVDWFRGCISDLLYNGVFPLNRARHRLGQSEAYDISWSCASEFYADVSSDISFVDVGSFMSIPNPISRVGMRWKFKLKTAIVDCLLIYTTGGGENADFVGVELTNGRVHVVLDKGGGPGKVKNEIYVSDGTWHSINIEFNSYSVEVTVDNKTAVQKLIQTSTRHYDLGSMVYLGGIEMNKRTRALSQGLKAADTSLRGCMKEIYVGSTAIGFPHAKVTKGLLSKCVWSYPCNYKPCVREATCIHRGVNSFLCLCDKSYCIRQDFPNTYTVYSKTLQLELLELTPLSIFEGQNVVISPSNINIILDFAKYGIRDSGILFSTVSLHPPKHGHLAIELWEKSNLPQTFTLLDLANDKVHYVHDGSESYEDNIYLDLELSPGSGFVLPSYLQGQHRFILHVNISAINDPPTLFIPTGKSLKLPQGTRKILNNALLNASDVDSLKSSLIYTVLSDGNGKLEKFTQSGIIMLTNFTQDEVDNGVIMYYHNGPANTNSKVIFQVSDGLQSSQPVSLRISVVPLIIELVNNTGAVLPHNSSVIINTSHLAVTTNAEDPLFQIIFKVIEPSQYGVLEHEFNVNGGSTWQSINQFSYNNLAQDVLRYKHVIGAPSKDLFKFVLSSEDIEFGSVYEFHITFIKLNLMEKNCYPLYLNGDSEIYLNEASLSYRTFPILTMSEKIKYTIKKLPVFGSLYFSKSSDERLVLGDNFTQEDINQNRIKYKMLRTAYVSLNDSIIFIVSAEHCSFVLSSTIYIVYTPKRDLPHSVKLVINPLKVMEGGRAPILLSELYINNITESSVTRFTPSQIAAGRLFYAHDGSESLHDTIQFFAISNVEDDFLTVGFLDINISLVNDNPPRRVVTNVFRIVKGGQRILTTKYIKFEDEDSDFDASNLVYTAKKGSGVYSSSTKTPILQFTQDELESGNVLIVEDGHDKSSIHFLVSDGTHVTDTSLDVRPSPPFVEITNNSHLIVSQGGQATVTTSNLFSDTNINIDLRDIRRVEKLPIGSTLMMFYISRSRGHLLFRCLRGLSGMEEDASYNIVVWPIHGEMIVFGLRNISSFKQEDIESGKIIYSHTSHSLAQDKIQFKVSVKDVYTTGTLAIRVFPHSYWEPLSVVANETLVVEEFTSVVITGGYLQVKQTGVPPSDITFLVISGPLHGYLDIEGSEEDRIADYEEKGGIKAFDQSTVNGGKLYYVESVANQTEDVVVIDVTNGVTWLRSLLIKVIIIPSAFHLGAEELSVPEGGSVTLPISLFSTSVAYYKNRITDYYLNEEPSFGSIVILPSNKGISKWTVQQTKGSTIKYIHDGSETTEDSFTIIARSGNKESEPSKIIVKIIPINDMTPVIVNKTCLKLWQGGSSLLTSDYLAAVDRDTPPENITFVIISASRGYIALKHNRYLSIDKFTQDQINNKDVLVVHDGSEGQFILETVIVDGKNKYGPITFTTELGKPMLKVHNAGMYMFPLISKAITSEVLNVSCSDSREMYFVIKKLPMYGKLLVGGVGGNKTNFTQSDIINLKVSYQHTNSFKNSSLEDSFIFDLHADFVEPLKENVFKINISVFFGGLDHIYEISQLTLTVEEGGYNFFQMNTSGITAILEENIGIIEPDLLGFLSLPPSHGTVCVAEDCNVTVFSDKQLQSGAILYQHDHTDTISDFIIISLYLVPSDVLLINVSITIKILPVNDQPFQLLTRNPHITVVHGQEVVITKDLLYTDDLDTSAENIIYEIINGPNIGIIKLLNNTAAKFTQSDINHGRVYYRHFGLLEPVYFQFKVFDGQFEPVYGIFNISISEIKLNISVISNIELQQGYNKTYLTKDIFLIETNADQNNINFNISIVPLYGIISVNENPSLSFTFQQLVSNEVAYLQLDMTSPNDTFKMTAFNVLNNEMVIILDVNVTVLPLVNLGQFSPISGFKSKIDLSVLDASDLAKSTSSNPVYKILKRPKHGRLKKIIRVTGEHKIIREKDISRFTHKEVQSNVIYFAPKKTIESIEDTFTFIISSSSFQPAIGELKFRILGESPSTTFKPPKLRLPKVSVEQDGVQIASPNMSDDYLLGLSMVTGTIALALLIVGFVSCGSKQTGYDNSLKSDLPDSLPRPPDELTSSPQVELRNAVNSSSTTLPQKKMSNNSLTSSELELNLRYPYGDEDWNSFGNNDNSTEKKKHNPMLRKNQYWV
ncbi:chondroitin sulfate proteoglycan 4 isoform X2 [Halyomorpha halys]|uniref:chondroitin sulfate proteoglycan 4 isoform X2 n=1 Tax=Halyomorpha halys TaxID=286706 RepID=UPI0034D201B2